MYEFIYMYIYYWVTHVDYVKREWSAEKRFRLERDCFDILLDVTDHTIKQLQKTLQGPTLYFSTKIIVI